MKQARHYRRGRGGIAPIWIVIHTAECAEISNSAEALANYAANPADGRVVSWHYAVDADSITQSVDEADTSYACGPGNSRAINIELAGRASQSPDEWADPYSLAVLSRAAVLVAGICEKLNIPPTKIGDSELAKLQPGICGHIDISKACSLARNGGIRMAPWWSKARGFGKSDHFDPGPNFPWSEFVGMVNNHG